MVADLDIAMTKIERRYQWRGPNGITWTKWYTVEQYESREEAEKDFPRIQAFKESGNLLAECRIV